MMPHSALLTLLIVLAGLRFRAMCAAPRPLSRGQGDQQQEVQGGTASAEDYVWKILKTLDVEDQVEFPLPGSGVLVTVTKSKKDLWDDLSLGKRGPHTGTHYTVTLTDEPDEPKPFSDLGKMLITIGKKRPEN